MRAHSPENTESPDDNDTPAHAAKQTPDSSDNDWISAASSAEPESIESSQSAEFCKEVKPPRNDSVFDAHFKFDKVVTRSKAKS